MFNSDSEAAETPAAVVALRSVAFSCDAVLFAATEYNYSVSPVLTNAIAWLSRDGPEGMSPIEGKPAAIMSAGGGWGGGRAAAHLRDMLLFLDMPDLKKPQLAINVFDGTSRFDEATGDLLDSPTAERVGALVGALVDFAVRFK